MAGKEFTHVAKKRALNNPAERFIGEAKEVRADNTRKEETKNTRLNLLMYASVCESMKKIALMKQTSVNDLFNKIAMAYIEEHRDTLEKYDCVFGEDK